MRYNGWCVIVQVAEQGESITAHELALLVAKATETYVGVITDGGRFEFPLSEFAALLGKPKIVAEEFVAKLSGAKPDVFLPAKSLVGYRDGEVVWHTHVLSNPRWELQRVDVTLCTVWFRGHVDSNLIKELAKVFVVSGAAPQSLAEKLGLEEKGLYNDHVYSFGGFYYWKPPRYNGLLFMDVSSTLSPRPTSNDLNAVLYGRHLFVTKKEIVPGI